MAALAADPKDVEVRQRYAEFLDGTGEHAAALEQWQEIVRQEPESRYAASSAAGCLIQLDRASEAVKLYRAALSLPPFDPYSQVITRWRLAEALRQSGEAGPAHTELRQGVETLEEAVQQDEASPHLLRQLQQLLAEWEADTGLP